MRFELDTDNASDVGFAAEVMAFFQGRGGAVHPFRPAVVPDPPPESAEELDRGRGALGALLGLWAAGGAFPMDAAEKITHAEGEYILLFVRAHGGDLPTAIREIQSHGELDRLQMDSVPTFLSMLTAVGVPIPRAWLMQHYENDGPEETPR